MKILVLGANGKLGSKILSEGREHTYLGITRRMCDFTKPEEIATCIKNHRDADIIVNCVAYTNVLGSNKEPELCNQINYESVKTLVKECEKYCIPLVLFSSDYTIKTDSLNLYIKSKLRMETITSNIIPIHILRIGFLHSNRNDQKDIYQTFKNMPKGADVSLRKIKFSPTEVNDLVQYLDGIYKEISVRRGFKVIENYNSVNDKEMSLTDFVVDYCGRDDLNISYEETPIFSDIPINTCIKKTKGI
jgi:dTDP-4-dehydrorhamnose reductase